MQLSFGRSVNCKDGSFGKLDDVVVDPATMRLTHLITSPPDAEPRLIPIELADPAGGGPDVALRCTLAATEELASVREYRDLQSTEETADDKDWDLGVEHVLALPYDGGVGLGIGAYDGVEASMNISYDRVPKGSAELRHASAILSADGDYLGGVKGFHLDDARPDHGRRPRREPLLEPLRDHDPGRRGSAARDRHGHGAPLGGRDRRTALDPRPPVVLSP